MAHERDHFLLINHNLIDKFLFIYLLKSHRQDFHKLKQVMQRKVKEKKKLFVDKLFICSFPKPYKQDFHKSNLGNPKYSKS